jgi:hypothetical protein
LTHFKAWIQISSGWIYVNTPTDKPQLPSIIR